MMTEQLGFSILMAPLAAVDRRALSQAWYSALHLARNARPGKTSLPATSGVASRALCSTKISSHVTHASVLSRSTRVPLHERRMAAAAPGALERRSIRSPLARKIERTFLDPQVKVQRATFAVGDGALRVHVSLQSVGERVRLVAVCAPSVRSAVARALAEARFALAARGIEMSVC